MFKHFIITEFNVNLNNPAFKTDKNSSPVLTEDWLAARFVLFEKYYLPSFAGQTVKDFKNLVYFDTDTPEKFKKRIAELQELYPFFEPKFTVNYIALQESIHNDLLAYCEPNTRFVLTSHVDNDDALHCRAIEKIQKNFRPEHNYGICLYKGYRLSLNKESVLLKNWLLNGPFVTLIEELSQGQLQTINALSHQVFFYTHKVKQIRDDYYWLQTIHGKNLVNELSGIPTMQKKNLRNFGLAPEEYHLSESLFWKYFWRHFLNIKNYIPFRLKFFIVRKVLKKKVDNTVI